MATDLTTTIARYVGSLVGDISSTSSNPQVTINPAPKRDNAGTPLFQTEVDVIICQCSAGISRSAGVAAALGVILNGSDKEIFNDPKYCPNRFVYRTILNEYENQLDNWSKE